MSFYQVAAQFVVHITKARKTFAAIVNITSNMLELVVALTQKGAPFAPNRFSQLMVIAKNTAQFTQA
jgi:hypothetical protein